MTFNVQIATGENEMTAFKSAFNQETAESVCARRGGAHGAVKAYFACYSGLCKGSAGVDSLKLVGIEKLMAKCSHFAEWVGRMG